MPYIILLLGLLWLTGCQPAVQPYAKALGAASLQEEVIRIGDGTKLSYQQWLPEQDPPEAVILALHGFNDYSNAFKLAGQYLAQHGMALFAYDQRGFGATEQRGIWPGKDNLIRDMRQVLSLLNKRFPDSPLYVMGESMGGAVVTAGCGKDACQPVDGLILVAPALWGQKSLNRLYRAGLWLMVHSFPDSKWTGEDLDITASDNLALLYAMGNDPNVIKETRIDAVYGLVQLMDAAYVRVDQLTKPVLFLYGARDEIIPPNPLAESIDALKAPYTVGYYPHGYHMLLRDLQREVVLADIVSWIRNRYRPLPSGADMGWKEELLAVGD